MNWAFLIVGGLVLGSLARLTWKVISEETHFRYPIALIGLGMGMVVAIDIWIVFFRATPVWFRIVTMVGYVFISIGSLLVVHQKEVPNEVRSDK